MKEVEQVHLDLPSCPSDPPAPPTQVSRLAPLASCTKLETLNINGCYKVSSLAPLASCPNLTSLDASNTGISVLAPLAALPRLERLAIAHTRVSDLGSLAGLTCLKRFHCTLRSSTDLGYLAPLAACPRLQSLRLDLSQDLYYLYLRVRALPTGHDGILHDVSPGGLIAVVTSYEAAAAEVRALRGWLTGLYDSLPNLEISCYRD